MPEPSWIPGSVAEPRPWRRSRARGSRASPYLLHSRCTPIKDNRETLQPETDHRRESRTAVHASNGVWDRIITLQTHNHERERELATPRLASSSSSLEPAGELRCEMRGTVEGERERRFSLAAAPTRLRPLIPSCAQGCFIR
jgi:hypothetical protein